MIALVYDPKTGDYYYLTRDQRAPDVCPNCQRGEPCLIKVIVTRSGAEVHVHQVEVS